MLKTELKTRDDSKILLEEGGAAIVFSAEGEPTLYLPGMDDPTALVNEAAYAVGMCVVALHDPFLRALTSARVTSLLNGEEDEEQEDEE